MVIRTGGISAASSLGMPIPDWKRKDSPEHILILTSSLQDYKRIKFYHLKLHWLWCFVTATGRTNNITYALTSFPVNGPRTEVQSYLNFINSSTFCRNS